MEVEHKLTLQPIGRVLKSHVQPPAQQSGTPRPGPVDLEEGQAVLEIDPAWAAALDGLEAFSHLWIVWWLDQAPTGQDLDSLQVRPEGRQDMPLLGIFATRSPRRPNPIAFTAVRLLERQGANLRVEGLDAFEGTPILDLKPYLRRGDMIPEASTPAWLEQLWRIHDEEREDQQPGR
jgi:tRNA-Thr(GGU) m(6)t(6)A37 methyltransferase TsaA